MRSECETDQIDPVLLEDVPLAYRSFLRDEHKLPQWTNHLDTNPRVWLNQGLRYLRRRRS